jgi:hypothetical protein
MNSKQTSYFKIGLVILLAILFVGAMANSVMTINRASPPPPPPIRHATKSQVQQPGLASTTPHATAAATVTSSTVQATSEMLKANSNKPIWPTFALEEIIAYDPFAIAKAGDAGIGIKSTTLGSGDATAATAPATEDAKLASIESERASAPRIHAVYQRGGQTAALAGSKTIRPGDTIEGAGRVVEVDQSGLMLEIKK